MDKALRNAIIAGIIIIAISFGYYLVVFIPKKEAMRIEQQKQEQELKAQQEKEKIEREDKMKLENKANLDKCLEEAQDHARELWKEKCIIDGNKIGSDGLCLLDDSSSDYVRKARAEARELCFKKFPQ